MNVSVRNFKFAIPISMLVLGIAFVLSLPAHAQGPTASNAACLVCHQNRDLIKRLPSGEPLSLLIEEKLFNDSVHGKKNIACVQCHTNISGFPHPTFVASDRRDVTLQMYTQCRQCHAENYAKTLDSIHTRAIAGGDRNAAVCTDCHTAHAVTAPDQPRSRIPQTCSQCHSAIYADYAKSVHGAAVMGNDNPDVPTCIDCHGVHNIEDPRTVQFRLQSPLICARCHANGQVMSKYGLSTAVFKTYVADFHGTTIQLFPANRDTPPRQAVCFDCHGIHDIRKTDDPQATVVRENLVKTCRKCHPDATENFPAAWVKHYEPSRDELPQIYFTELFFGGLTATVIVGLMGHIFLDFGRVVIKKIMGAKQ